MTPPKTESSGFFKNSRKCITITSVNLLKNASGDKRIRFGMMMLLSGGQISGAPEFITSMFEAVAKDETPSKFSKDVIMEGANIEFFSDDKKKTKQASIKSATLKSFATTSKKAKGQDNRDVVLTFACYSPASKALWDWGYEMLGMDTFAEFNATQMTFGDSAPDDEGEEEE